jgi:hypothetical protein
MSKKLEILKAARELIAKPGGWTRKASARYKNGHQTLPSSPAAARFCATGALRRCQGNALWSELNDAQDALERELPDDCPTVVWFNDDAHRKQEEVIDLYDRAIAAVETEEAFDDD